jgi:DNA repair protein RecO (recombination protein O)
MNNFKLDPAYILHRRLYRDTSLLVDFFTQEHGLITAIAKGARMPRSPWKGLLQPFTPLYISWYGRHELVTLKVAEARGRGFFLAGSKLWNGFYLNELLIKLLKIFDPQPTIFEHYSETLLHLNESNNPEPILRAFELHLLKEMGYGLQLTHEAQTHDPIQADEIYQFQFNQGFIRCLENESTTSQHFLGSHLLSIHQKIFSNDDVLKSAKRLARLALAGLLDNKPLKSREIYLQIHQ